MTRKTVILTEIIAPYRIPVFNALARREDVDLHVMFLAEQIRRSGNGMSIKTKSLFRIRSFRRGDGMRGKTISLSTGEFGPH